MISRALMNFCPACGTDIRIQAGLWPKHCPNPDCKKPKHWHPVDTVVLALIETENGLLVIKRNNEQGFGKWAFPGGYQNYGETVERGAARETREETGLVIHAREFTYFGSSLSHYGESLLFFKAKIKFSPDLIRLCPKEVQAYDIIGPHNRSSFPELAFPSHQDMLEKYFSQAAS